MSTRAELVAAGLAVEEVREFIGVDSLAYLSLRSLVQATGAEAEVFCRACFDGRYPIEVPEAAPSKHLLEGLPEPGRP